MPDPKQKFETNTITRRQIARQLNDALNYLRISVDEDSELLKTLPKRFKSNDDRLTNKLCEDFAHEYGKWTQGAVEDCLDADPDLYQQAAEDVLLKHKIITNKQLDDAHG